MPRICINGVQSEVDLWLWLLRHNSEVERFEVFDPNYRPGPDPFGDSKRVGVLIAYLKDGRGWFMANVLDNDRLLEWLDRPRFATKPLTWYGLEGYNVEEIAALVLMRHFGSHGEISIH